MPLGASQIVLTPAFAFSNLRGSQNLWETRRGRLAQAAPMD